MTSTRRVPLIATRIVRLTSMIAVWAREQRVGHARDGGPPRMMQLNVFRMWRTTLKAATIAGVVAATVMIGVRVFAATWPGAITSSVPAGPAGGAGPRTGNSVNPDTPNVSYRLGLRDVEGDGRRLAVLRQTEPPARRRRRAGRNRDL
jgi:hypothetical protein